MEQERKDILEAIGFFEQILQSFPDDRVSLEFLGDAYEQIGDEEKARTAWKQLVSSILKSSDVEPARAVRPRLNPYFDDPEVAMLAARLEALAHEGEARTQAAAKASSVAEKVAPAVVEVNLNPAQLRMSAAFEEVNLAWSLHEHGFLDAAEYEKLTVDMTESTGGIPDAPVSSLLSLRRMHPEKTEAAVAFLFEQHKLVPLRLDIFEIAAPLKTLLPPVYVRIRGVFPFARLGRSLLVALLNPGDATLRKEVASLAGMPCTFFLAHPDFLEDKLAEYPAPEEA